VDFLAWALRARFAQGALFKTVAIRHIDEATLDAYARRLMQDTEIRRDLARFLREVSGRYTLEAARSFPGFDRPVLIAWDDKDLIFSPRLAFRLQHDFPDARLEAVAGSHALSRRKTGPGNSRGSSRRSSIKASEDLAAVCRRGYFPEIDTDCNNLAGTV